MPREVKKKMIPVDNLNDNLTMQKNQLGQFYTTGYAYILSNMTIPDDVDHIIEPFVGKGDLLGFVKDKSKYTLETYDIDPKYENAIKRDTLQNPPCYKDKFVLCNPPYLARNKSKSKVLYDAYKCNDLYKCFIINLIDGDCKGGIIIIPLNFMSSIRKADVDLRKQFIEKYSINILNIFEEQVFVDTSYAVCSMLFKKRTKADPILIKTYVYPLKKTIELSITKDNNYTIGGEIYNLPHNPELHIQRATQDTKRNITNILLKCIDDSLTNKLGFKVVSDEDRYIDETPKRSARSYATLVINKYLTLKEQKILVKNMNDYIEEQRLKYNSLFLTNFRDSNTIARKRISFDLAFKICNYVLTLPSSDLDSDDESSSSDTESA
jgi:hypothetical protein